MNTLSFKFSGGATAKSLETFFEKTQNLDSKFL